MDLIIQLQTGKTIADAATKVAQFNTVAKALLVNGPIKCNPTPYSDVPVYETITVAVIDENGDPVLDADGNQVTNEVSQPKVDANGDPVTERIVNEYGYLGDFNTLVNEFNYCTVRIDNYRKLKLSAEMLGFLADTFIIVVGQPVEDSVDADGNPIEVWGHGIA